KEMALIPGGKGANQAYAAAKLGGNIVMLGAVGNDTYGKRLTDNLASAGVDVSHLKTVQEASTGIALVVVDQNGDNRIVVISGANNHVDIPYVESNLDVIRESDIVVMQLEIPLETVVYAARKAKEFGKMVILDPAPAREDIPDELYPNVDIIKPNEHELMTLLQRDVSRLDAVRELLGKGTGGVLVTMGSNGSQYYDADGKEINKSALIVNSVDTTGAGDSYTAALAVALSENADMEQAMELASTVGAITTTKIGAQTSFPSLEEVKAWNRRS
nr:bifunctional hydroxymethylpyrimidine kinase/phosphomethylpyrimidine kinase [Clostridia bacterium]